MRPIDYVKAAVLGIAAAALVYVGADTFARVMVFILTGVKP